MTNTASRAGLALLGTALLALLAGVALPQGKPHAGRDLLLFAGFALPLEAFALVGERLLHPREAVDLASHFARATRKRAGIGNQEGRLDAADFDEERSEQAGGILARRPAGVFDLERREIVEMRHP